MDAEAGAVNSEGHKSQMSELRVCEPLIPLYLPSFMNQSETHHQTGSFYFFYFFAPGDVLTSAPANTSFNRIFFHPCSKMENKKVPGSSSAPPGSGFMNATPISSMVMGYSVEIRHVGPSHRMIAPLWPSAATE